MYCTGHTTHSHAGAEVADQEVISRYSVGKIPWRSVYGVLGCTECTVTRLDYSKTGRDWGMDWCDWSLGERSFNLGPGTAILHM